jgi:hypothetical protein
MSAEQPSLRSKLGNHASRNYEQVAQALYRMAMCDMTCLAFEQVAHIDCVRLTTAPSALPGIASLLSNPQDWQPLLQADLQPVARCLRADGKVVLGFALGKKSGCIGQKVSNAAGHSA